MKTPRIEGAELIAVEDVNANYEVDVWKGSRGYYLYFHDLTDDSLVRSLGPLKSRGLIMEKAKRLAETLRRCR
jgi:hypothetical protein